MCTFENRNNSPLCIHLNKITVLQYFCCDFGANNARFLEFSFVQNFFIFYEIIYSFSVFVKLVATILQNLLSFVAFWSNSFFRKSIPDSSIKHSTAPWFRKNIIYGSFGCFFLVQTLGIILSALHQTSQIAKQKSLENCFLYKILFMK